ADKHRLAEYPFCQIAYRFSVPKFSRAKSCFNKYSVFKVGDGENLVVRQPVLSIELFAAVGLPVNHAPIARTDPQVAFAAGQSGDGNIAEIGTVCGRYRSVVADDAALRKANQQNTGQQH